MTVMNKVKADSAREAYEKLKASKDAHKRLIEFKDLILTAPNDGISEAELIQILKKELPAIKITVKKLKELRESWVAKGAGAGAGPASELEGDQ